MIKMRNIYFPGYRTLCIAFHRSMLSEGKFVFMRAFQIWIPTFRFLFLVTVQRLVIYRFFLLSASSMFSKFKGRIHSKRTNKVDIIQYDIHVSHDSKFFTLFSKYRQKLEYRSIAYHSSNNIWASGSELWIIEQTEAIWLGPLWSDVHEIFGFNKSRSSQKW